MAERRVGETQAGEYPEDGYGHMDLKDVFEQYGPVHGLTELDRRGGLPPYRTAKAEIGVTIMQELGQLVPVQPNQK